MWYNVGSKHEAHNEKGMAHLIEHMLFKGTTLLSETDINLITHKLSGYSNAFTSQDSTCYVFRLPSSVWEEALTVFAECMNHARFENEFLSSEVKTVIEELRLYRDDYQTVAIEQAIATIFSEHPYHYPIIGSSTHLARLTRDELYNFYKKHYHPGNATLVIVGDVVPEQALAAIEAKLGSIPARVGAQYQPNPINDDIMSKKIILYRDLLTPWCCYCFTLPGLDQEQNHLHDLVSLILGGSRSSRLYQKLVVEHQYAVDVDCFTYEFFEKSLLCIAVYPVDEEVIPKIEPIIKEEIAKLMQSIEAWELTAAKKNLLLDTHFVFESIEKQATLLGNSFMATQDENSIDNYIIAIEQTTEAMLTEFTRRYLRPSIQHQIELRTIPEEEKPYLQENLKQTELLEQDLLAHHQRSTPVEAGRYVNTLDYPPVPVYNYPTPTDLLLPNGLNVIMHHNPLAPYVHIIFNFKSNPYYDPDTQGGLFTFTLLLMTTRTDQMDTSTFNKVLQQEGIRLYPSFDGVKIYCLKEDANRALERLHEVLTQPSFDAETIEQVRTSILNELDMFWDTPTEMVDQLAREHIYAHHPFSKNPLGSHESIEAITADDIKACFESLITPHESSLFIVGDLPDTNATQATIEKLFGQWNAPVIKTIEPLTLASYTPTKIHHEMNRDQVVLALTRDTIATLTDDYYPLVILDIILTGGSGSSSNSRLFNLREKTGLFYTIDGSLIYGSGIRPNVMIIKTIVSPEQLGAAEKLISETLLDVYENGVSQEEFELAKNLLIASSIELFETNTSQANTFLFLKKCNFPFNLFDKQGALLSILKHEDINLVAKRFCNPRDWSIITVGRSVSKRSSKKGD